MLFDLDLIEKAYTNLPEKISKAKKVLKRPMTLVEKILYSHTHSDYSEPFIPGTSYVDFAPDRVAMQDATAQMALLQFISAGKKKVAVPSTVHCDHLIQAELGAEKDLQRANKESHEVFEFLRSTSEKYGIGFWRPGAGIIHQVVLENYAFPGGMMIGTDSHTPNAGGLGMVAVGVGGADSVDVMAGMPWELRFPKTIGVHLTGKLSGWASAKDVILIVAGILTVKGGTGAIIEYFGEGTSTISCTGKATICNMGAEIGATTSIFPYDDKMSDYLKMTGRKKIASAAEKVKEHLRQDLEISQDPEKFYDQVIEIDLSALEPYINGPYTPDRAWKLSEFAKAVKDNAYPSKLSVALIGSCTNSSFEDMERATSLAKQAKDKGLKAQCPLTVTPGSEMIRATMDRDGQMKALSEIGGLVLANACGPCIGQWRRHDVKDGEKNSILTSYNRNFAGRNDANPGTHSFVASPEIVIAFSLKGSLEFNPMEETLTNDKGEEVRLDPPKGLELPPDGFATPEDAGYQEPATDGDKLKVSIDSSSERLHFLTPFARWDGKDFVDLPILMKAQGKCTTDHISPAGKWLRYRGHLDNISNNMFIGAVNAFRDEIGKGKNTLTGNIDSYSANARNYKKANIGWVAIGDENYGEGSSREHAAMEPRHLGCKAIIVKSFARIHETNLKKQGVLALTFKDENDYEKIKEDDKLSVLHLDKIEPGKPLFIEVLHADKSRSEIEVNHTYNENQIAWFKAGSALNLIKNQTEGA